MTKENITKFIILGFLNQQSLSGYQIRKFVERSISFFWNLSNGQIYPTLKKLQKDKLVLMKRQASATGPDSKVYSITEEGKKELNKWLEEAVAEESFRSPLLLKIFLGGAASKELTLKNLKEFLNKSKENLLLMELYEKNINAALSDNPDHLFMLITIQRGKQLFSSNVQWAEDAISLLKKNS